MSFNKSLCWTLFYSTPLFRGNHWWTEAKTLWSHLSGMCLVGGSASSSDYEIMIIMIQYIYIYELSWLSWLYIICIHILSSILLLALPKKENNTNQCTSDWQNTTVATATATTKAYCLTQSFDGMWLRSDSLGAAWNYWKSSNILVNRLLPVVVLEHFPLRQALPPICAQQLRTLTLLQHNARQQHRENDRQSLMQRMLQAIKQIVSTIGCNWDVWHEKTCDIYIQLYTHYVEMRISFWK